jgi:hypothetical protein
MLPKQKALSNVVIKMTQIANQKSLISVLKVLLKTDDIEIIKYTLESLIDDLEDSEPDTEGNDGETIL